MIRPYRPEDLQALKRITAICFEGVSIDRNIEERFGQIGGRDWQFRKLRAAKKVLFGNRPTRPRVADQETGCGRDADIWS